MSAWFRKFRWLVERRGKEAELREELEFHLDEEAEARRRQGLPPAAARSAARRELGNLALVGEDTRAAWGWTLAQQFAQDVCYAFRTMAAAPLFSLLAICSLALGIGANTAIYSFMDAILLRSLPVADPDSLVIFQWHAKPGRDTVMHRGSGESWHDPNSGEVSGIFPYPAFEFFQQHSALFSSVFGHFRSWRSRRLNVSVQGLADVEAGTYVTGDYFKGLGVSPAAGRFLTPDDDRVGGSTVTVVSHAFAEQRLGGAAHAPGQRILIDNLPFSVVGVAPPGFSGVDPGHPPDLYLPMHNDEVVGAADQFGFRPAGYLDPHYYWIQVMARLRPGVTRAQAQAAMAPLFRQWVMATAANEEERANLPALFLEPGDTGLNGLRRRYTEPLYVLMALVGLILALACANVANLLLARAAARSREMALRLSVGAGRFRLIRQLLTESVLLASLGGAAGIVLAIFGMRFLAVLLTEPDLNLHPELNWHVLGVAIGLSLLTGVIFGLAPALRATRVDVMSALKQARAGQPAPRRGFGRIPMGSLLMAAQVAISLVILVAAGLFVRTLANLHSIQLGFSRENILLFQLDARKAGHQDPEIAGFYAELRRRFAGIPGVRSVSLSDDSLLDAGTGLYVEPAGPFKDRGTHVLDVGPDFFITMGIPLRSGRDFSDRDRLGSPLVAVINEAFAKAKFPGKNSLGQHLSLWKDKNVIARDMEIVGICGDARYGSLTREIPPVVYMAYDQGYPQPDAMVFALRTHGDPLHYAGAVKEIVRRADPRIPVVEIRTQAMDIDRTISEPITFALLCSGFAILALAIACVGLYGTVSYNVARRTGEIGIRMALGARRGAVVRMVLGSVLILAAAGLAAGLTAALTASKFVKSFLYGIEPNDPPAIAAAAAILLCAALLAAWLPARKASRIDPMTALRHE